MRIDVLAPSRRQVAAAAAIMVTGAGWIHLLAAQDHRAHPHLAVFFLAAAVLQLSWAALVMHHVTRGLLLIGIVLNLGLVLLWLVSRTTGVMFVPGAGHAEPVGVPDAAASGLELVAAAALGLLLTTRKQDLEAGGGAWLPIAGAVALTLSLVVAAGFTGTPPHEHLPLTVHP